MDINLFETSPSNNQLLIKKYLIEKAIENDSALRDINYDGSNISSIVSALNYVYTVLNTKLSLLFKEISDDPELETNIAAKMKLWNFEPRRNIGSQLLFEIQQTEESGDLNEVITFSAGEKLVCIKDDFEFYYIFDTDTTITEVPLKFIFKEGKYVTKNYFLTQDVNFIVIEDYKWNIDNDSLVVTNIGTGSVIPQLRNDDSIETATEQFISDEFYFVDYTRDGSLILRFSDGVLGKNVTGEIQVEFYETLGTGGNNIYQTGFELQNQTKIEIYESEMVNRSDGGLDSISLETIKSIMSRFNQTQDRIVTVSDLELYLGNYFPGWKYDVIDATDLPITSVIPGRTYVSIYKISGDGIVTLMDYDSYQNVINFIDEKVRFGSVVIYTDKKYSNTRVTYDLVLNQKDIQDKFQVVSNINDIILKTVNGSDLEYINTQLLQQAVISTEIPGLIDFNVKTLSTMLKFTQDFDTARLFKNYAGEIIVPSDMEIKYDWEFTYSVNYGTTSSSVTFGREKFATTQNGNVYTFTTDQNIQAQNGDTIIPGNTILATATLLTNDLTGDEYFSIQPIFINGDFDGNVGAVQLEDLKMIYRTKGSTLIIKKYEPKLVLSIEDISDNTEVRYE